MVGGAGNDVYVVDNAGDIVNESTLGSDGTDTVQSSISFSLADTAHVLGDVENLTLLGSGNINGTGNALNNVMTGNAGANILLGGEGNDILNGGAGNDTLDGQAGADNMRGGAGSDIYVVDNAGDIVNESHRRLRWHRHRPVVDQLQPGGYCPRAWCGREPDAAGSCDINATGNSLNNVITGNGGANILLAGRVGNDTLNGGAGMRQYARRRRQRRLCRRQCRRRRRREHPRSDGIDTVQASISFSLADPAQCLATSKT